MQRNIKNYFTKSTISNIITVCAAVVLFFAVFHIDMVKNIIMKMGDVAFPFVVAFVMAFLLNTPVKWFERNVFSKYKYKRALSITCSYIIATVLITALVVAAAPQLEDSIVSVVNSVPEYIVSITAVLERLTTQYHWDNELVVSVTNSLNELVKSVSEYALGLIPQVFNFSVSIGAFIIDMFMAIIASIYMLTTKERLVFQLKKILFSYLKLPTANLVIDIGRRADYMFSKFINGKLIDSLIIGIICCVGMMFIYPPYAALISIIVGVTNIIPFFGPFIGAIPSTLILIMKSPWDALIFVFFVLALQQFDGNILGPKILGDSTGLAPIWVLLAITIGGGLFGFVGMVAGVPTFAVIYSLISENMDKRLAAKNLDVDKDSMTITKKEEIQPDGQSEQA